MISWQNKYFFLSAHFLENMNSNYRAEHRCLLTKPTTITAMSKNQQKNHIPVYSKGICSQSKLTSRKPKHRNLIVSHDLCSLSRLYWVLQIPGLPLKAIKFLALLGATKALTMKTCMLHSRWVCSLADWKQQHRERCELPPLNSSGSISTWRAISKRWSYFQILSLSGTQTAAAVTWRAFAKPPLSLERKIPFLTSPHACNSASSASVNYSNYSARWSTLTYITACPETATKPGSCCATHCTNTH